MQSQRNDRSTYAERRAMEVALKFRREFGLKELARHADVKYWQAGKALSQMARTGDVERTDAGLWRVVWRRAA